MEPEGQLVNRDGSRGPYTVRNMPDEERENLIDRLEQFPSVTLAASTWSEIATLARGNSSVGKECSGSHPVVTINREDAEELGITSEMIIRDLNGKRLALVHVRETRSTDSGDVVVAGDIEIVRIEDGQASRAGAGDESHE